MSAEERAWAAAAEAPAEIGREAEHKPAHEGLAHSETQEHSKDTTEDDDKYTARDAARDAKEYVAGKEQARQQVSDEQLGERPISATQKLELVRERAEERERIRLDDADKQRDEAARGSDASRNIYGAMPIGLRSVTEAVKQKLTMPGEVVVGHRRREHEGAAESHEVEAAQLASAGVQDVRPTGPLNPHRDRKM